MEPPQHEIDPLPNDGFHLVLSTVHCGVRHIGGLDTQAMPC
jgi:hypothetical protein